MTADHLKTCYRRDVFSQFFDSLSDLMVELKRERPEHEEASVLMESHIPYDYLIRTMDTVRSVELPSDVDNEPELFALFTEISVGDAP